MPEKPVQEAVHQKHKKCAKELEIMIQECERRAAEARKSGNNIVWQRV